jgi:archaellum component FlaC
VIGHDSYDELVSRLASMNIALENEMAKTSELENENSILKNTCEQQKHLLYDITCSHEELKMAHEELSVTHDNLVQDHDFLTTKLSNEKKLITWVT